MTKVAAYVMKSGLAQRIVPLMVKGTEAYGDQVDVFADTHYVPQHLEQYDVAILWGYIETCQAIMAGYRDAGKSAVYLDLAYWHRDDYYKVAVNARHATAYFQWKKHDDIRRKRLGVWPEPYGSRGTDGYILVAGMGQKAAWAEKLEPVESWERNAIAEIKKYTDRKIVYRPKPSWLGKKPIEGVDYSNPEKQPWEKALTRAYAVVTHHSNMAVDGLVRGIPAFVWDGVAVPMGLRDLSLINTPLYPQERDQWLNDVSYCQWSTKEMRDGTCWSHLKSEDLIA